MNEPVAWLLFRDGEESYPEYTTSYKQMREWETYLGDNERIEPHYTTPQTKPLSDEEIPLMTILQNAQSVRLGDAIYKDDEEYEKLKKIVITAVKWALKKASEK